MNDSPSSPSSSKLPKFLQKQVLRERSASRNDPGSTGTPISAASPPNSRKTSKFLSIDKSRKPSDPAPPQHPSDSVDDPPVIVEPVAIPRPRTRSERPASSAPEPHHSLSPTTLYSSTSSTSRISDRLSGWFHHTFSTSSTDLSALLAQQAVGPGVSSSSSSGSGGGGPLPRGGKGPNPLLMAAKHGKGHLDKAMRYLLDSDAVPDKCSDPIWLLGLQHPGFEPSPTPAAPPPSPLVEKKRRSSASPPVSFRSSTSSTTYPDSPLSQSTSSLAVSSPKSTGTNTKLDPSANWPPAFYLDFTSRVWLTYRSQFSIPIRDIRLGDLSMADNWEGVACPPAPGASSASSGKRTWPWGGGEKTWNTDSGWGCMLRTGQSLLANALVHTHLGRDWRRPPYPVHTADYATYVQILTWFFDTPSPEAPFSVHRMALAGKEFGTDVGQWFGPSVAAGAIRTLVSQFPECGLAVAVATDSTLYQSQVFTASHGDSSTTNYRSPRRHYMRTWGDRPVLLLLGIRLGIECVNPIYYDTIKRLYEFPQSVGIAGGRPGSSYYFVGSQSDNLFYLDPHHPRPAVPLRSPPSAAVVAAHERRATTSTDESDAESGEQKRRGYEHPTRSSSSRGHQAHSRGATSTSRSTSSSVSSQQFMLSTPPPPPHAPLAPSPLQQQFSSSSADSGVSYSTASTGLSGESRQSSMQQQQQYSRRSPPLPPLPPPQQQHQQQPPPPSYSPGTRGSSLHGHGRWRSASQSQSQSQSASPRLSTYSDSVVVMMAMDANRPGGGGDIGGGGGIIHSDLDLVQQHYCTAYRMEELKTFHCDRVRKMPLSGLDPSMLIGFLCRDEADWWDFRRRVGELPRTIFSVQDEPPTWPSDSDDNMGLESMSEPDDLDLDDDEEGEGIEVEVDVEGEVEANENDNDDEAFFDTRSAHSSRAGRSASDNKSEDVDTEDDPVGPITPGPGSKFEFVDRPEPRTAKPRLKESDEDDEDSDEGDGGRGGGFGDDNDDIEDDWADPLALDSIPGPGPGGRGKEDTSPSPPSSSNVPPLAKSRPPPASSGSTKSLSSTKSTPSSIPRMKVKPKKEQPVPVPGVVISSNSLPQQQQQVQEHYPFPVTPADEGPSSSSPDVVGRSRQSSATRVIRHQQQPGYRMHTARARDGGRTQSGGVKGVLFSEPSNS